jgi:DNA-directed RNA polymerase specialized sigma24 family protein
MVFVKSMIRRGTCPKQAHRSSAASTSLITIIREAQELQSLAGVILGGEQHVEECIADALRLAEIGGYVSPEWLKLWVQRTTAQAAADRMQREIRECVENCGLVFAMEIPIPPLNVDGKRVLRTIAIDRIWAACNALERAVLLLHTYLGFAVQDCALLLGCHRSAILSACSSAFSSILHESPAEQAETGVIACVA